MSTPEEIGKLHIWQWGRFFYWRVRSGERFDPKAAIPLSANLHLIPANPEIRNALLSAREGDLIRLEGQLVDVDHPDLGWWRTSRTRSDTGDGACEILLVRRVTERSGRA